jgi:AcrR family transcriptional regulator
MNASQASETKRPGRPRSEDARRAILAAAFAMLQEHGAGRVTIDAVASRAGVGKPTIYRYWPNARALEMAAMLEQPSPDTTVQAGADAIADLRSQLFKVVHAFANPRGRQTAQMLASAAPDSEISKLFRNQFILKSREEGRAILARAIVEGLVRADLHMEAALDMIYGPFFYRLLVGHAPLDQKFASDLVEAVMTGIRQLKSSR